MNNTIALSSLLLLTIGCGGGGPVDAGTSWTMQTTETATRTSYWLRDGGTPVESIDPGLFVIVYFGRDFGRYLYFYQYFRNVDGEHCAWGYRVVSSIGTQWK